MVAEEQNRLLPLSGNNCNYQQIIEFIFRSFCPFRASVETWQRNVLTLMEGNLQRHPCKYLKHTPTWPLKHTLGSRRWTPLGQNSVGQSEIMKAHQIKMNQWDLGGERLDIPRGPNDQIKREVYLFLATLRLNANGAWNYSLWITCFQEKRPKSPRGEGPR